MAVKSYTDIDHACMNRLENQKLGTERQGLTYFNSHLGFYIYINWIITF